MRLTLSADQELFRREVAAFIADNLPEDIRRKGAAGTVWEKEDHVRWQRIVAKHGWGAPGWPREFGGTGWDPLQRFIFDRECALAFAPREIPFGTNMVAPVIMRWGTPHQKDHFLPRIISLEHWWAQGYSEPGAGSDLASLKTSAVRDGDHYVVNGQKIWTTLAHHANWIFCLVRTSNEGKRQAGISFLLIDMSTPGVTVRPIRTIDGEHELNEVFFDNACVPIANRIGEENEGWSYAKYLLTHERTDVARVGRAQAAVAQIRSAAHRYKDDNGQPLIDNARFCDQLAWVEIRLMAIEQMALKLLVGPREGLPPGSEASMLKVASSELHQQICELALNMLGPNAAGDQRTATSSEMPRARPSGFQAFDDTLTPTYFNMRKTTIYGGSSEVQKNIIAQVLGL